MPSLTAGSAQDLEKYLKSLKGQSLAASTENLVSCVVPRPERLARPLTALVARLLKRRQIRGSEPCAFATAHILLQVVARSRWQNVDELLANVGATGRRLVEAQPREPVVANIVRRVLALIRDEAAEDRTEPSSEMPAESLAPPPGPPPSLSTYAKKGSAIDYVSHGESPRPSPRPGPVSCNSAKVSKSRVPPLLASPRSEATSPPCRTSHASAHSAKRVQTSEQVHALRSEVIDGIEEIMDEMGQADEQMAALAEVHVLPGDHVLVHQPSPTVQRFVLRAALKRRFTVLIATEAPREGAELDAQVAAFQKRLSSAGVTAMAISGTTPMAYMARVDKVILGARAVMANGSVVADAGAGAIARAAREMGRSVVVLTGVYKLSPETPSDEASLLEWGDPATCVSFADVPLVSGVEVRSAVTELVPPELVDTYMTNLYVEARAHTARGTNADARQGSALARPLSDTDRRPLQGGRRRLPPGRSMTPRACRGQRGGRDEALGRPTGVA